MKRTKRQRLEITNTFELRSLDIIGLLRQEGSIPDDVKDSQIEVCFKVPGGADWTGLELDLDDLNPVYVRWKVTETKETGA